MDLIRSDLKKQHKKSKEIDSIKILFNQTVKRFRWTFAIYECRHMLSLTINQLIFIAICILMNINTYLSKNTFYIIMAAFLIAATILLSLVIGAVSSNMLNRINNDIYDIKLKIDHAFGNQH